MRLIRTMSVAVAFASLLSSCYHNKTLVYLQDNSIQGGKEKVVENSRVVYRLQPSDVISVQIKGAGETAISNVFSVASAQSSLYATPGNLFLDGYSISNSGTITMPLLGELHLQGLTLEEAQELIASNAGKYLRAPVVMIKLTSFKVTVLGEVKNPGYYYVYNERISILEALGLAGDMTTFGNRKNVKLVRQRENESHVASIDLTDPGLLSSDYFFLMPGDVLYVQPLAARAKRTNLEVLNVVFAGLTTAVLIMTFIAAKK